MLKVMAGRGPDGAHTWTADRIAFGHGALHATPESVGERMPLVDPSTGNVLVADVRLDNRGELLSLLGLDGLDPSKIGDGRLLLDAYCTWGEDCVDHLLGDFAFGIWDERRQRLFLARDHFGAKPLTYHWSEDLVAFASDSRAVVGLEGVPKAVNRDRVIDFLVGETEWLDTTTTLFERVDRLPPARTMTVSSLDRRVRRYWHLPEAEVLHLGSDAEYEEATREILDLAVNCRLRGRNDVGVTLSGGIDSSSIAATALLHGPVRTYSGVSAGDACIETALIEATTSGLPVTSTLVDRQRVREICGDFAEAQRALESPFSNGALPRTVFTTARSDGCRSVLTGVLADEVVAISPGVALRALLKDHQPSAAIGLVVSRGNLASRYGRLMLARTALSSALEFSQSLRELQERRQRRSWTAANRRLVDDLRLSIATNESVRLAARLESTRWVSFRSDGAGSLRHRLFDGGYAAAALERYDRSAAESSVECRTPFMDRRVVEFFQRLPPRQLVSGGWTKSVLRRSMVGQLPPRVIWSHDKQHLGSSFTLEWLDVDPHRYFRELDADHPLHEYVDASWASDGTPLDNDDAHAFDRLCLGLWLEGSGTSINVPGRPTLLS